MANGSNGNGWKVWGAIVAAMGLALLVTGAALDDKASRDHVCAIEKAHNLLYGDFALHKTCSDQRYLDTKQALSRIESNQRIIARELGISLGE